MMLLTRSWRTKKKAEAAPRTMLMRVTAMGWTWRTRKSCAHRYPGVRVKMSSKVPSVSAFIVARTLSSSLDMCQYGYAATKLHNYMNKKKGMGEKMMFFVKSCERGCQNLRKVSVVSALSRVRLCGSRRRMR